VTQLRLLQPPAVPSLSVEEPPTLLSETADSTGTALTPSVIELFDDSDEPSVIELSDDNDDSDSVS